MSSDHRESCPVCWRDFSPQVVPYLIPCGHSYCQECSTGLKSCPLCRKRLSVNYSRVTNYSLLSAVDKMTAPRVESKEQATQTERVVKKKPVMVPAASGQPVVLAERANTGTSSGMQFKFSRDRYGGIRSFQFSFN